MPGLNVRVQAEVLGLLLSWYSVSPDEDRVIFHSTNVDDFDIVTLIRET